jgi:LmbE family N-acetylglucosaminyl deacetylase
MVEPLKLLAVFPHPDDESLGLGPTLAKYSVEGVETYLVCATRGERGWTGPEDQDPGFDALARIREAELRCAAGTLGLKEVNFLDYIDGDIDQADPQEAIAQITSHIRRIRPQVVVTFPLDGNYGHPDHIALAQLTAGALVQAASCDYHDPFDLPPFSISKYYHMIDTIDAVQAFSELLGPISMDIDGVERQMHGWPEWAATARLDTREHFDTAWQAVLCHQSQLPGYGSMVDLPCESLLRFWGEATFVRVYSLVSNGRKVESDLFEGLR